MRFDIVIVTYNSEKWLDGCVAALAACNYALGELRLIFVDNCSTDSTLSTLNALRERSSFGGFDILRNKSNVGFGNGCNVGAEHGNAPFIFFLNADTCVFPDVFSALDKAIAAKDDSAAAFECRQLPIETGHHFNPVTLETTWASGAALLVRRLAFERVNGFDKHLFMYCEDVDLSWRLRASGYKLYYTPLARVTHFSYAAAGALKLGEYASGFLGNLLLRYKFGSLRDIVNGHKIYLGALRRPLHFTNVRKILLKGYLKHFVTLFPFLFWRFNHKAEFSARAAQFDGGFDADRGQYLLTPLTTQSLVSVIVRTYARPNELRRCLTTLKNQTYRNLEIIVCEDGSACSRDMISAEFSDLPIKYLCDGVQKGRSLNGNLGLLSALGEWCIFLDDDDLFYPDHIECMLCASEQSPTANLILGSAMAMLINSKTQEVELRPMVFDRIDIFTMCQACRIPLQTGMFRKGLFEQYGGLLEGVDANEDWGMWLKFLAHATRANSKRADITRLTSIFVQEADNALSQARKEAYAKYDSLFFSNDALRFNVSLQDMRGFYRDTLADVEHLLQTGQLEQYLADAKKRYKD